MKVVMVGTGYVGLVSGACFSELGADVICIDKDKNKIDRLISGEIPMYEPGLDELVSKNVQSGRLNFTTNIGDSVGGADLVFIAVGTPTRRGDGHADLKYVYAAAEELAFHLSGYTVVVNKSTVPLGTAREVRRIISKANPDADFDVASNPEFLREGSAIEDFLEPYRVVIGIENERAETQLKKLYEPLNLNKDNLLSTSLESAELIKYASNAFLATKISFINELSSLCEKTGADVHAIAKGMGLDDRIGDKFLQVGPGFGGSCFPKDTLALIRISQEHGVSSRIVESVLEVNAAQKARMVQKVRESVGGSEANKNIAVLGLTFKAETDDMRDAPSLSILPALVDRGAIIRAHDPEGLEQAKPLLPESIEYFTDMFDAVENADAVILMTEWKQYEQIDLKALKAKMKGNIFIDLRNLYEPNAMKKIGFEYFCIGRT
jgi:UDPglucose 6-dehydrogenase